MQWARRNRRQSSQARPLNKREATPFLPTHYQQGKLIKIVDTEVPIQLGSNSELITRPYLKGPKAFMRRFDGAYPFPLDNL
jgi:hypothetical protein